MKPSAYFADVENKLPIVYRQEYNVNFGGLEKYHVYDLGRWGKVFNFLKEEGMLSENDVTQPPEASEEDLRYVHSQRYLDSLKWSVKIAQIFEFCPALLIPNFLLQRFVLRPLRFQTSGTILAGKLAIERGWAINIGGGFPHCFADRGGGFCVYADITLCIRYLLDLEPTVQKAMIIDLSALQGNGYTTDFEYDPNVYVLDVYNAFSYPSDYNAKLAANRIVEVTSSVSDEEYLALVENNIDLALKEFTPDVILYNAGTDILRGDRIGGLFITPAGIIKRDELVFTIARQREIPIVMLTSGGHQETTARIAAASILNLRDKSLLSIKSLQ